MSKNKIWLRAEIKPHERRTPLTPQDAKKLLASGHKVVVESSKDRIFSDIEYQEAGCELVEAGSWQDKALLNAYILGIKELPNSKEALRHTHIYFAHVYKGQDGAEAILSRFKEGEGLLYDLEFLQDEHKCRVAFFSYWAGVAGCAVTLLLWIQKYHNKKRPFKIPEFYPSEEELVKDLEEELSKIEKPSSLVIGAPGRCAKGVMYLLKKLNLDITAWYKKDTHGLTEYPGILNHELLFNCIYLRNEIVPFITSEQLKEKKKLSMIGDISCDPDGPFNPLPIYNEITTFKQPTVQAGDAEDNVDVMAIDHLPSFLPRESSIDFSNQLLPHLQALLEEGATSAVWEQAARYYYDNVNA